MMTFSKSWTAAPFRVSMGGPVVRPLLSKKMGQVDASQIKKVGVGMGLVITALSAGAAWVGIRTGMKESGFLGVTGWAVGVAGALVGGLTALGTIDLLATPTEEIKTEWGPAERLPSTTTAKMPVLVTV